MDSIHPSLPLFNQPLTCPKCGETDPAKFYVDPNGKHAPRCRACKHAAEQARYAANPEARERKRQQDQARALRIYYQDPALARERRKVHLAAQRARGEQVRDDRKYRLKGLYDLTLADYAALVEAQGGLCAICGQQPKEEQNLVVDHDHQTGQVRRLLCDRCNVGLGCFRDDLDLLRRAVAYLESFRADAG